VAFGASTISQGDANGSALTNQQTPPPGTPVSVSSSGAIPNPTPIAVGPAPAPGSPSFTNNAQTADWICADGSVSSYTLPAGFLSAISQEWADTVANYYASFFAFAQCPPGGTAPPAPIGPDGNPAPLPIPNQGNGQTFFNQATPCDLACPDGTATRFYFRAGLVRAQTQLQANTLALAYACLFGRYQRICIGNLPASKLCSNMPASLKVPIAGGSGLLIQVTAGAVPDGLTFTSDGKSFTLAGTPTTPGTFTFQVDATDGLVRDTVKSFTLSVMGFTDAPPGGTVGTAYGFLFAAAGGVAPYMYQLTGGVLPFGLGFTNGAISGTPSLAQATAITVKVTDATGFSCEQTFPIGIAPAPVVGPDWTTMVWDVAVILPPAPGSITAVGDTVSGNTAGDDNGAFSGVANLHGSLSYTGGAVNCLINVTAFLASGWAASYFTLQILQDGNSVYWNQNIVPGSLPALIPFSLIAGVNSLIEVQGNYGGFDQMFLFAGAGLEFINPTFSGGSISVTFQLKNAP
jgi:hypothetical protein